MTARMDDCDRGREIDEGENGCDTEAADHSATVGTHPEAGTAHKPLPWIGALPNPRIGPMVVLNDSGYLVPLWTAGELLRGCKYFWHGWRD
ncbi:MAG: hypothetical protein ACXWXT_13175 [Candidatus Binatia bacterium]